MKQQSAEYKKFASLLTRVLQTPHSEIKAKLDAEKQAKKQPRKRRVSRAYADKD
jgi:hypothetical protein